MDEPYATDVSRLLGVLAELTERAERVRRELGEAGAEAHLVDAVGQAERELRSIDERLGMACGLSPAAGKI